MSPRPPSARALRTQRAQALVAESRALLLCQATAAGAGDLARARVRSREAGARGAMVVGSSTFRAVIPDGWRVPPSSGTLLLVSLGDLERAPAVWRALGVVPRVVPGAVAAPGRWWTGADLLQWGTLGPSTLPRLLRLPSAVPGGPVGALRRGCRGPLERMARPPAALLRLLRAHSSAG